MNVAELDKLKSWIAEASLAGRDEGALLTELCERLCAAGMPLARAGIFIDTLHPIHEGRMFRWDREKAETKSTEYARTDSSAEAGERWRRSTFYRLLETGESALRRKLSPATDNEFPVLAELRSEGMSDYLALITRFGAGERIGGMDCLYSSWMSRKGFSDADIADLQALAPTLALAAKAASLARVAETLVETYLGRDAGRRVLSGRIDRGVADRLKTVLWFSDLRGYTKISDTAPPDQIIPLLNDYADTIVSAIQAQGGDVLKLIGDGILAIFTGPDRSAACRAAMAAALDARRNLVDLNERRAKDGLPVTEMYLGLHLGEVFYGNIGSRERLDFTVVGPAVNEVSRIASMCRSVDQWLLTSSSFAAALDGSGTPLVSVGRYALRGVGRAQDLYTIEPG